MAVQGRARGGPRAAEGREGARREAGAWHWACQTLTITLHYPPTCKKAEKACAKKRGAYVLAVTGLSLQGAKACIEPRGAHANVQPLLLSIPTELYGSVCCAVLGTLCVSHLLQVLHAEP